MTAETRKAIKIAFIGGGSENWAPTIIRDIIFKEGMERADVEFALLDIDEKRAQTIKALFDIKLEEWGVERVRIYSTTDSTNAITGADFVIICISTGRLPAMAHDLAIPENYSIYQTVGDTAGPGGWARALRNIPVFKAYARQIKELAPNTFALNYTNPMGALTKILADELGNDRVVGLCHGLFECYDVLKSIFGLESEEQIEVRFGGMNHFFWILDLKINGSDGCELLREKLQGRNFGALVPKKQHDLMGWGSQHWLAGELFANYGYMPYIGDRHTCEFFSCYLTNKELMERFKLARTSIAHREEYYRGAYERIQRWIRGEQADQPLDKNPSRETAADIIKAITFNDRFTDVVNMVNTGQISNLPLGAVVRRHERVQQPPLSLEQGAAPGQELDLRDPAHAPRRLRHQLRPQALLRQPDTDVGRPLQGGHAQGRRLRPGGQAGQEEAEHQQGDQVAHGASLRRFAGESAAHGGTGCPR